MKDVKNLWVGQSVYVGVNKPKKARVWAEPFEVDGRWFVPCEFLNGRRENALLFMVYAREQEEVRAPLKAIVKALGYSDEQLETAKKRVGQG